MAEGLDDDFYGVYTHEEEEDIVRVWPLCSVPVLICGLTASIRKIFPWDTENRTKELCRKLGQYGQVFSRSDSAIITGWCHRLEWIDLSVSAEERSQYRHWTRRTASSADNRRITSFYLFFRPNWFCPTRVADWQPNR